MDMKSVMKQLAERKEMTEQLENGYAYRNINEYLERLESVLGTEHYNTEYRNVESLVVGNQLVISCVCRITILDDNFQPVLYKEGCGATEVSRYKKDKEGFVNLKGAYHVAETDAFKNACKALGVFGFKENKKSGGAGNESSHNGSTQNTQSNNSTGATGRKFLNITCASMEPFEIVRDDRNSGQPVYKVSVAMYEDRVLNREKKAAVIFYPNKYAKATETLNSCIGRAKENQVNLRMHVQVSSERDGIPQYIFDSFI